MATMQVSVVSAEKELFSGEAAEVYARSVDGEIGILPGHQPALISLSIAPVRIKLEDGDWEIYAVHEGTMFFRDNRLVVLADIAEHASEIDVERARAQKERIESRHEDLDEPLRKAIRRSDVRLTVAEGIGEGPTGGP
jgi:F-type H+-transporting ATPase subunit epsilon